MNREEIIALAIECGDDWYSTLPADQEFLIRFAGLIATAEREACKDLWEAQKLTDRQISDHIVAAVEAEREACAAPVQEPVACQHKKPICDSQGKTLGYSDWKDGKGLAWWPHRAFYTTPPAAKRPWFGLTDEEQTEIMSEAREFVSRGLIDLVEAKLKEKNNG